MASSQVARCPVTLFEAIVAGPWRLCPAIGELNVHEARGKDAGWLVFQLHDLLDGQVLFQTTRPSTAYFKLSERFHIIKQENGTYRGLGFSDADAAAEIFDFVAPETSTDGKGSPSAYELQRSPMPAPRVTRALFPSGRQGSIDEMGGPESPPPVLSRFKSKSGPLRSSVVLSSMSPHFSATSPSGTPSPGTSPASVLASSSRGRSISLPKEKSASLPIPAIPRAVQGLPVLGTPRMSPPWSPNSDPYSEPPTISCGFSPGKTKSAVKAKLQRILSGGRDRYDGPDMDIGYPYNIQHEGHIGWTPPPSTSSESAWMDSPSSSSFVSPPLSSFGSPGSDELGGNWTAATPHAEFAPPAPPPEYVDKLPAKESPSPSPVTPTKAKRTLSFSRRRNRTQPQTLHPL